MTYRFVAKRPAPGHEAQVYDRVKNKWVAGTSSEFFHEVAVFAEAMNRRNPC